MKNSPASSCPVRGSMPSVNEYPRRSSATPSFCSGAASRTWAVGPRIVAPDSSLALKSSGSRSAAPGQRRPARLAPSDHGLLVGQPVPVPGLDQHADPARHEVGPAPHPGLRLLAADPDMLGHRLRVVGVDVVGAVLEAQQVAWGDLGGGRRRGPAEAQLRPAQDDGPAADPGQVANRVEGDLRVVGARLDAQIAVASQRVQGVARQRVERAQCTRQPGPETESIRAVADEQRVPEAERERQPRGGRDRPPRRCQRVALRGSAPVRRWAPRPSSVPPRASTRAACARGRPGCRVVTSKAAKTSRSCIGVAMPA